YTASLDRDALRGARVGYVTSMVGTNPTTARLFAEATATLEEVGAAVVPVEAPAGFAEVLAEPSGSTHEFRHDLEAYVARHPAPPSGPWPGPEGSHTRARAAGQTLVAALLDRLELDVLVYPTGTPYGTQGQNMRLSPNTGMPAVTVPMGQATEADGTVPGAGVNLELLGRDYSEGDLLGFAYAFEQATQARTTPAAYGPLG